MAKKNKLKLKYTDVVRIGDVVYDPECAVSEGKTRLKFWIVIGLTPEGGVLTCLTTSNSTAWKTEYNTLEVKDEALMVKAYRIPNSKETFIKDTYVLAVDTFFKEHLSHYHLMYKPGMGVMFNMSKQKSFNKLIRFIKRVWDDPRTQHLLEV